MPGEPKFNLNPEQAPENAEAGKEKTYFENHERPKYRYYYHGTLMLFLDKIKARGFKFREYLPDLTLSPLYGFDFLEKKIKGDPSKLVPRAKHLSSEEKAQFKPEEIKIDDSILLIIEPTKEYQVHSTNEGMPNVFSTPDQIPADIDETVRTRNWESYQQMAFKEPIFRVSKKLNDGIKRPGMHLNRKMLPTGELVKTGEERVDIPREFPASSVKMVIRKDPEFKSIFQEMRRELSRGSKIDLTVYKQRLMGYFKNGQGIIKNEVGDQAELAENMVVGEFEHFIVTAMRKLYLEIQKFKGKRIVRMSSDGPREDSKPAKTRDEIMDKIEKFRSLMPDNDVFRRYIEIYTAALEKELNS